MSHTTSTDTPVTSAHEGHGEHHVVSAKTLHTVFATLLVLTLVTYLASTIHMGRAVNIVVAMAIAFIKAGLVAAYFMHLKYDKPFNTVVLLVSLGFLALFLGIATLDTAQNEWRKDPAYAEKVMARRRAEQGIQFHEKHDLLAGTGGEAHQAAAPPGMTSEEVKALATWAGQQLGVLPAVAESPANAVTDAKVALGQRLYFDPRLSKNHDISCNSCHGLSTFGVDGKPFSPGHRGQLGGRNSPTVLNAALQTIGQFWDAREPSVEAQAKKPILNPVEMAMASEEQVTAVLRSIPGYAPLFAQAFPGQEQPITYDTMAQAIGAFERRLLTPGRFDAFMQGDLAALTAEELRGLATFKEVGCTQCHTGPAVGGTMMDKLGKLRPYESKDKGLFESTGQTRDMFMFKVPQLRNVAKTGPWFHDGSVTTLEEAVKLMGAHQLDKDLTDEQVRSIVAFLGSLTGELNPELAKAPELPPSGPSTPAPDPN